MKRAIRFVAIAIVLIGSIWSLARAQDGAPATAPTTLPSVQVTLSGKPFTLEVADSPDEQERGLMYRREMAADHGMIFVFRWPEVRNFWMKNTYIPLDIIYLDDDARVLNIEPMQPLDLSAVTSDGRAKYAIELNAGVGRGLGLKRGDRIALPDRWP